MQPYFFPYLGYFQLIAAVDRFVFYDDVAYIKQGWINRNRILVRGNPHSFSVPIDDASSNRAIRDTMVSAREFPRWRHKFLKTFEHAYGKAPCFPSARALLEEVVDPVPGCAAELARRSVLVVNRYIGLTTECIPSSVVYGNQHLRAQARVVDICRKEGAILYVNAVGGRDLYDHAAFRDASLALRFIRPCLRAHPQFDHPFVPGLSILDALAFNPAEDVRAMVQEYSLEM